MSFSYSVNPIDEEAELEGGHDPDNELTDLFGLDDDDGDEDILVIAVIMIIVV